MEKIKKTAAYCSESLDKVRDSEWSEPVATALTVTGTILTGIGHFVPGVGIIGGAFKIGSDILNPKVNILIQRMLDILMRTFLAEVV